MMLLIAKLLPHYGVWGIAMARLSYGPITLLLYIPLVMILRRGFTRPSAYGDGQVVLAQSTRNEQVAMQAAEDTHPACARCYANLLGVQVEALDMEQALTHVKRALVEHSKGYVSMIGVHGIMEAQRSPSLAATYARSILKVPDGMPTVWVGRSQGHKRMQRVAGPDLMLEIFRRQEFAGYTHFLYGGKQGVAAELAESFSRQFPWARIVGTWTPPFRELSASEEEDLITTIGHLKPDMIWVGISTPKQDHFMRRYSPRLDTTLMFGVGAAFDFHTGRIKDCADWIKSAGLQWVHRLVQDPRRLWRRYLFNNPAFIWRIALQLCGLRTYPIPSAGYAMERTTKSTVADPRTVEESEPVL